MANLDNSSKLCPKFQQFFRLQNLTFFKSNSLKGSSAESIYQIKIMRAQYFHKFSSQFLFFYLIVKTPSPKNVCLCSNFFRFLRLQEFYGFTCKIFRAF